MAAGNHGYIYTHNIYKLISYTTERKRGRRAG